MRISELAARSGVPATTLRFYEQEGLLPADRSPAGHRVYGRPAVERLGFIGAAKSLGLPLAQVRDLLSVWESGPCRDVRAELRPRLAARLEQVHGRRRELLDAERRLQTAVERLERLPERDERCDADCSALVAQTEQQPQIACSLTGAAQDARRDAWRDLLRDAPHHPVEGGQAADLPLQDAEAVMALVREEQRCCPFLAFTLRLDRRGLRLEVTAPAEGAELVDQLFSPGTLAR
ncbi:MerR family transcriptional regulator [Geodermatophilus sp. TF02-6]|uniref:MerR family transcriptional regulator n=1 Tax=Geodermatophilus sp. TF02-6 TaxID=2250575 RepID=UPI000DE840C9|nr:MerR family transcriptional regulator [Geodermatophilus sp. TF02-6]RBY81784.1 MerR family transcriptional regulator [Geodermatophilus sp. TF02-6]